MTKPFSLSVLVLKVNAFFRRRTKDKALLIESEGIVVNLSEMTACKGGQEISFTKNEWKMLKLFLENPRQILSKKQILEQLFDSEGDFVDENTVAVNIRRLREKIEEESSRPVHLVTVRGVGYRWEGES